MENTLINTIARLTATRPEAAGKFIKLNNLDPQKLYDALKISGEERKNFATALAGYEHNEYRENIIAKYQLNENVVVTKGEIDYKISQSPGLMKIAKPHAKQKIIITEKQLEMLLKTFKRAMELGFQITEGINEGSLEDTFVFDVYEKKLQKFMDKVNEMPTLLITNKKKDGNYYKVSVSNSAQYELWIPLWRFYEKEIKI